MSKLIVTDIFIPWPPPPSLQQVKQVQILLRMNSHVTADKKFSDLRQKEEMEMSEMFRNVLREPCLSQADFQKMSQNRDKQHKYKMTVRLLLPTETG